MKDVPALLQQMDESRDYLSMLTERGLAMTLVRYALDLVPTREWYLVVGSAISAVLEQRQTQDARAQMPSGERRS